MTPTEEKQQYVRKLSALIGLGHEDQLKRLPNTTLKAIIDKVATVAPAPVGA